MAELIETQRELEESRSGNDKPVKSPIVDERYEFIEEIARGGAAVVWRVRDRHLGRETAVKYLLDSQDNLEMRARLEREARLCSRLVHPGIVPIHELSSFADQRPFVSMKLVEGKTLLQLLESVPPPSIDSTIEIFTKACQAIAYSHDKGIIHRDLKPSNIMVGSFGEVQIMDWGLAKDLGENLDVIPSSPSVDKSSDTLSELKLNEATIVGSVFGTIAYMSPEQARGQTTLIDKWSDVFSLGAVLCRVLTGIPPYQEMDKSLDQDAMLVRAQRGELQPAFARLERTKPRMLAALAIRCMAVQANARPADAGEIVNELTRIRNVAQRTKLTVQLLAGAASLLLVLGIAIAWVNRDRETAVAPVVFSEPAPAPSTISVRELVHEKVVFDSETAMVLLKSNRRDAVLDNYRSILDYNKGDKQLCFQIAMALLNSERFNEGEELARELIRDEPENVDYQFVLSESLFWQGKFQDAKTVMLKAKALKDEGAVTQFPIEMNLSRLDRYMDIVKQESSQPKPRIESLDSEQLKELALACSLVDMFEPAITYYNLSLSKVRGLRELTIARHGVLMSLSRRCLRRKDLSVEEKNILTDACLGWMQQQFDCVPEIMRPPHSNSNLIQVLKSNQFDFARNLVDDTAIKAETRERLRKLLAEIQSAEDQVLDN